MHDDDTRFRHLEKKIGVFVLVALAGVMLAVATIGIQQEVFAPKTRIHFVSESGQDISKRTAVKLSGFNIGQVEDLSLTDSAKVKVELSIKSTSMKWLKKDAKARLMKEGVIGDTIIEIVPGSEQASPLGRNERIAFERGLGAVADELNGEIVPLIDDVRRLARNLDGTASDFRAVLHEAHQVIAGLPDAVHSFDALLQSAERNLQNLENVTANTLPELIRNGNEVVVDAVVDSLSETWPISRYIESPEARLLRVDSYERAGSPVARP